MTTEFLKEITYYKLVSNIDKVVKCYGVSQDPTTKDYMMVMKYVEGGNMRQYLKENYSELDFPSDIYSFGILACEVLCGLPPYHNLTHDNFLAVKICQGLRPKFQIKIPPFLEDLFTQQIQVAERCNQTLPEHIRFPKYEIHPKASYYSKPINTKKITELLEKCHATGDLELDINDFLNNSNSNEKTSSELTKEIKGLAMRTKRQLSLSAENQGESKSIKLDQEINTQQYQSEPMKIDYTAKKEAELRAAYQATQHSATNIEIAEKSEIATKKKQKNELKINNPIEKLKREIEELKNDCLKNFRSKKKEEVAEKLEKYLELISSPNNSHEKKQEKIEVEKFLGKKINNSKFNKLKEIQKKISQLEVGRLETNTQIPPK
ncbi:16468_t:CDS:2 [Entrophospora sp. SA101]|nr:16468_t:CDS:2 [Entrophospora sp. SA101]